MGCGLFAFANCRSSITGRIMERSRLLSDARDDDAYNVETLGMDSRSLTLRQVDEWGQELEKVVITK